MTSPRNAASTATSVDTVTLSVIRGALMSAVLEVGTLIERTSMSPNINEKHDYLIGLTDPAGRFVSVVRSSTSSGANFVRPIARYYPIEQMRPGDLYWYNDPYLSEGALSHTPDLVFVAPAFSGATLLGFCASFGHVSDIGGPFPGSLSSSAASIFHEGIRIPPVRIVEAGEWNEDLLRTFVRNSRFPDTLRGDIRAMTAATQLGVTRLSELADRFGGQVLLQGLDLVIERSSSLLSTELRRMIPEGTVRFAQAIDGDGLSDTPYWVRVTMTRHGDRIEIDASESDDQAPGPSNYRMDESVPMLSLAMGLPLDDPTVYFNGSVSAIVDKVTLRPGSILSPRFPAATGVRSGTMRALQSAMQGLIAQVSDGQTPAPTAVYMTYHLQAFGGHPDSSILCSEGVGAGLGARLDGDGPDGIYGEALRNFPCEYVENRFPMRIEQYAINTDSGGPGLYRGGCGVIREFTFLGERGEFSPVLGNATFTAWGVAGGQCGRPGSVVVNPGTPDERTLAPVSDGNHLTRGDVVRISTSGGGGWGHPFDREAELVRSDVVGGFVSLASAHDDYGVVLHPETYEISEAATATRRGTCRPQTKMFHQGEYVSEIWG